MKKLLIGGLRLMPFCDNVCSKEGMARSGVECDQPCTGKGGLFCLSFQGKAEQGVREESSNFLSLNGMWKFNWVKDQTERPVNFYRLVSKINIGWTFRCPESGK